jgi:hypothetical protein
MRRFLKFIAFLGLSFHLFLSCKSRLQSSHKTVYFQAKSGDYHYYYMDQDYIYQLNCKDRDDEDRVTQETCDEITKLEIGDFKEKLKQSLISDGEDKIDAERKARQFDAWFEHRNAYTMDNLRDIPEAEERLQKIFSPSPPGSSGQVVLGQIPKRPAIDPMKKQVVVWNLKDYPGTNMPLSIDEVFQAMNDLKQEYWGHPVNEKLRQDCLNNLVPEWSDLMFHYYCQIGAARKCFTLQAKDQGRTLGGYTTAYEICKTDDDFKWISRNQADIFRYIIFTVGDPEAFNQADQDEVINEFYGVTSAANCKLRPRRNAPAHPEFPCGRKIGRIALREQESWGSPVQTLNQSQKNATQNNKASTSSASAEKTLSSTSVSDGSNVTEESSAFPTKWDSENLQMSSQKGLKSLGAVWYLTPSGTGNCVDLCSSKGGLVQDLERKVTQPEVCAKLGERILESSQNLAPYRNGTGACDSGCLVHSSKKQFFSCSVAIPNVKFITLGWSRLCPCKE